MITKNIPINGSFVYLLKLNGEVVYVGQSINYPMRISAHRADKMFDSYDLILAESHDLLGAIEFAHIVLNTPRYNKKIPPLDFTLTRNQIEKHNTIEPDSFDASKPAIKLSFDGSFFELWFLDGFYKEKNIISEILKDKVSFIIN